MTPYSLTNEMPRMKQVRQHCGARRGMGTTLWYGCYWTMAPKKMPRMKQVRQHFGARRGMGTTVWYGYY
jgi:hypothetical protein